MTGSGGSAEAQPTLLGDAAAVPLLRLYETLIQQLPVAVIIAQQEGNPSQPSFRYIFANEAAGRASGLADQRDIGTALGDRLPHLLASDLPALLADTLSRQVPRHLDVLEIRQAGGNRLYRGTLLPLTGNMVGIVLEDLTEKIAAEKERRSAFAALERSNVDLEQFAYAASHDLQEPLRTVTGFTTLLARRYRGKLDSEADEFIDFIVEGCTRLKNLIDDLLVYSRIDRADIPAGPSNASEAFDHAIASLQRAIDDTGAEIVRGNLSASVDTPLSLLSTVFQNLLENALKFRSAASPRIVVDAERDGVLWRFRCEDNGIGIAPEYRERIFRLFQRLHSRADYDGTGIGLTMCKKIVERSGGQIWVESAADGGSVFLFTLPALEDR